MSNEQERSPIKDVEAEFAESVKSTEAGPTSDASSDTLGQGGTFLGPLSSYKIRPDYEGIHRFKPEYKWTNEEEKKLVRRIDVRIMAFCCVMFFALQLDRGNIGNALSDNMLVDLGLTTNDYNLGQSIFYVSFLLAELPSQVISKRLGPDRWIPIQMVSWSIVAASQSRLNSRASFFVTRSLLGIFEGGFIPDIVLYCSYFYTGKELPIRMSWFWTANSLTGIISALLAAGILKLRYVTDWPGWRWLFLLEGILTGLIGILAYFYLPPSPTQTASRFRGKNGWFTEHEETIMVTRVLKDDPGKGGMHNRQALSFRKFWLSLTDYDLWPIYLIGLTFSIPAGPPGAYLTLTLKTLGFDTFQTNLLTIPTTTLFILQLLFWTWVSERIKQKFVLSTIEPLWALPFLIALAVLPDTAKAWDRYAILTLLLGHPYVHAILVAMCSRQAGSVRTRTVASAIYNMCVQLSGIISSNIYRADDAPYYHRGNRVLVGIAVMNVFIFLFARVYYGWRNRVRDRKWNALTPEEQAHYLETTTDQGNKRLDFRFAT